MAQPSPHAGEWEWKGRFSSFRYITLSYITTASSKRKIHYPHISEDMKSGGEQQEDRDGGGALNMIGHIL